MKQRKNRRPFARPTRRASAASVASTPVFQPLEPRKLLTTLVANPDLDMGQTNSFFGWVAMPAWYGAAMQLDASTVEERSVRLGIFLLDDNVAAHPTVTILDLDGHPLFPWTGLQTDGTYSTEVEVSMRIGPEETADEYWGSDDDESESFFGLDTGYMPGWRVATDSMGNFLPGVWIPDGIFHPVRQIDWDEDAEPVPEWDTENVPENFTLVIPETGYWDVGMDGFYETEDDSRLPLAFGMVHPGAGTDDRQLGTADDAWVNMVASDPWSAPDTMDFEPHLIERRTGWTGVENLYANDGKADFNNGIGRIIISGATATTKLVFFIMEDFEGDFQVATPFALPEYDRIGVAMNSDGSVYQAPGMGSIIIGNPTNANWTVNQPELNILAFLPPGYQSYDRSTEGIIQEDPSLNETMGRIYIDGALFGVTRLSGALEQLQVGFFGGKMFVDGDVDFFNVVGDASYIEVDGNPSDTRAALTVGRVLGSFVTGRNNSTTITVEGDFAPESIVDKPFLRSDKVVVENETDLFNADEEDYANAFAEAVSIYTLDPENEEQANYLLNDTLGSAQYAGRETGLTVVQGVLGTEPDDDQHDEGDGGDDIDYYAIAVDATRRIRIQLTAVTLMTLQDAEGNIVASRGTDGTRGDIYYTPTQAGVLYIVIDNTAGFSGPGQGYALTISDAAPVSLGEVRAGGALTYRATDGSAIITQVGSIGTIRIGQDVGPDPDGDAPYIGNLLIQSGASIWNITSGGFIAGTVREDGTRVLFGTIFAAEEHIGELLAGYGRNAQQGGDGFAGGSIGNLLVNARGDIGLIHARSTGGIGFGELTYGFGDIGGIMTADGTTTGLTYLQAGGSIGTIRAESRILADPDPNIGLRVNVGAGERIDLIEAGAIVAEGFDLAAVVGDAGVIDGQALIENGLGGNVRFFRAPFIWGNGVENAVAVVTSNSPLTIVDDSGAIFTIKVSGNSAAFVKTHAVASSVGVATVRIEATLGGGGNLTITNNSGNVEIGDIVVVGDGGSRVILDGSGRTDVYMIRTFGGINSIENRTSGDIVAIDSDGIDRVIIEGNLGKTFSSTEVARSLLGPRYDVTLGDAGEVGDPLLLSGGGGAEPAGAGAPFDMWLNGLAVRASSGLTSVGLVRVDGTIVDIYSEVDLVRVTANADNQTPFGEFHGIEGSVYTAGSITRIDLGDGLVDTWDGPFTAGIIGAAGVIGRVEIRGEGHNILGDIVGASGIDRINATQGSSIIGSRITTNHLDSHFTSADPDADDVGGSPQADIGRIMVNGGDIINSSIAGINVNQINIKNGIWDSNRLRVDGNLNTVRADEFVYTYVDEGAVNLITVVGDATRIETQGRRGDIKDLIVDIIGNLRFLRANSIDGTDIDVDEELRTVDARARVVRSSFTAGAVRTFNASEDITRVTFNVAGPVKQFRSRNSDITRIDFTIDGPDGRLDLMDARGSITGDIRVSGEIRNLRTREGDIIGRIETFSGDGFVRKLQSGRDLILDLDIDRDLDRVIVGRNLSGFDDESLKVHGDFGMLDVRNGTFDGAIIVEGSITRTFRLAAVADGSEITARGSIATIDIDSGLTGNIAAYTDAIRRLDIGGDFNGEILARNGTIDNLSIVGNVSGTVHADEGIRTMRVSSAAGRITSDADIDRLDIDGDATGSVIRARWELDNLTIRGNATGSVIGAGRGVSRVTIDGNADATHILGGLESLGDDFALGGAAANADTFSSGNVENINIRGTINNVVIAAGIIGGADGSYATLDADTDLTPGLSNISNVRVDGAASGTNRVLADTTISNVVVDGTERTPGSPGANMVVTELDQAALTLPGGTSFDQGTDVVFTDTDGDQITLSMRGSGTGIYTLAGGTSGNLTGLVFNGTDSRTNVDIQVTSATGNGRVDLDSVQIRFADDADLGNLTVEGNIDGTDGITIDGSVNTLTLRTVNTSGTIAVGGEASRIVVDAVTAGRFMVTVLNTFDDSGAFGGTIFSEEINTVNVRNGTFSGVIWGRDSIGTINNNSTGAVMDQASISTLGEIRAINAATIRNVTYISAGELISNINISGDLVDSDILAGFALGSDGRYGGSGTAADRLTGGTLQSIRVNGSVIRSSVAAGVARGQDRFYGTGDDIGSIGFGLLERAEVLGGVVGSNFNSQNWAFTASAQVMQVRVGGEEFIQQGNVNTRVVNSTPLPLVVQNIRTRLEADTLLIDIYFNEEIDISTILLDPNNPLAESAIRFENPVDPMGVKPTPNDDYTISYDREQKRATIRFNRSFSQANPGVYTLVIDGTAIQSVTGIHLDANRDGITGDTYYKNFLVGDAGDRTTAGTWDPDGDPLTPNDVEFMDPTSMSLLLDDLVNGTGTKNHEISFLGRIGDHPDTESFYFPERFDVDLFAVTLAAGDILRATLSDFVPGSAFVGSVTLRNSMGQLVGGGTVAQSQATLEEGYFETTGGTYYIMVAGTSLGGPPGLDELIDISNNGGVFTPPLIVRAISPNEISNDIGNYELNVMVFNDGDTGFNMGTTLDLVDGEQLVTEGFIGFDENGVPTELFGDADVYDISSVRLADNTVTTQLEEGMMLTVTLRLSQVGGNLGGRYEVGVFQTTETTGVVDGLLMGAPGTPDSEGFYDNAGDITYSFRIPEAGTYAIMIQGNIETNYELLVTVDTSTQGDRRATPEELNILIETNGGFAEWYGRDGTTLHAFDLSGIGFDGLEAQILSEIIEIVTDLYDDAGITVHVSIDPADFVGEDFTTVFLANDYEPGLYGIASTLDPQNQGKNDEAIVFVPTFASLVGAGDTDTLSLALANVVAHEAAHTLGLRHAQSASPFGPFGIMDTSVGPENPHEFIGDPNDPYGTATALTDSWFFGMENETDLLQLIFDVDT